MSDTELLAYIIDEMKKAGIVYKGEREIFNILVPNEPWEKYKKSWYHWKKQEIKTLRKSKNIKEAISKTLHFDYAVWGLSDSTQKKAIKEGIELYKKSQKPVVDLGDLMPKEAPLSNEQKKLLNQIENVSLKDVGKLLKRHSSFFKATLENQTFVLSILNFLYKHGCYNLLEEMVFPALLPHNRGDKKIKIIEAHTLGSMKPPRYRASAILLDSVKVDSDLELIDIKTAAISNIRRYRLSDKSLNKEELKEILKVLIKHYYDTFILKESYHYYPAINLLYMLKLYLLIFTKENIIPMDISQIQDKTKPSISKDIRSKNSDTIYYAKITELEIKMLSTKKQDISREFGLVIESLNPSPDLLKRTLRQIEQFLDIVYRFANKEAKDETLHIKKVADVFRDSLDEKLF